MKHLFSPLDDHILFLLMHDLSLSGIPPSEAKNIYITEVPLDAEKTWHFTEPSIKYGPSLIRADRADTRNRIENSKTFVRKDIAKL